MIVFFEIFQNLASTQNRQSWSFGPYACQASGKYYFEVNLIEGRLHQRWLHSIRILAILVLRIRRSYRKSGGSYSFHVFLWFNLWLDPRSHCIASNDQGAEAPQVGLLSKDFKPQPGVASTQAWGNHSEAVKHFSFMNSVESSWMPPYSNVSNFWWAREDKSKPDDYQWLGSRERTCSQVAYKAYKFAEHLDAFGHLHVVCRRELETVRMVGCDAQGVAEVHHISSLRANPKLSKDVGRMDGWRDGWKHAKPLISMRHATHLLLFNGLNGTLCSFGMFFAFLQVA